MVDFKEDIKRVRRNWVSHDTEVFRQRVKKLPQKDVKILLYDTYKDNRNLAGWAVVGWALAAVLLLGLMVSSMENIVSSMENYQELEKEKDKKVAMIEELCKIYKQPVIPVGTYHVSCAAEDMKAEPTWPLLIK